MIQELSSKNSFGAEGLNIFEKLRTEANEIITDMQKPQY